MGSEPPTSVEPATQSDYPALCALDQMVAGGRDRRQWLAEAVDAKQCVVARMGGTLVGFAVVDRSFYGRTFLSLLIVHPMYRRRGMATVLLRRIEEECATGKLFTSTNASNRAMQSFCQVRGFVRSGYIENLDEGDPEIVYFKRLVGDIKG